MIQPSRLPRRPGAAQHYPEAFLDALAERIRDLPRPALVAIDGWGCGGKSSLCGGLFDRLEPEVVYLGMDEFFLRYPFPPLDPFPHAHLRWDDAQRAVSALAQHGEAEVALFDWDACAVTAPQRIAAPIVVVDGLFSQHLDLAGHYDFTIWVQSRLDSRSARVAIRDGAETVSFWEEEWAHRERAIFEVQRPWDRADLIVAGADVALGVMGEALRRSMKG